MAAESPNYLLLGELRREYLITPSSIALLDQPGGNLLYAACGHSLWGDSPGLLARVGEDYPRSWLDLFRHHGLNTDGVLILPETHDLRSFIAYTDLTTRFTDDPVGHFARLEMSFPKSLLGFEDPNLVADDRANRSSLSIRKGDLPDNYQYAAAAHLCPLDYLSHNLMPAVLRQLGFSTITLDPGPKYMRAQAWADVLALLPGLSAFLVSEEDIRSLFAGRSDDLWEMAEALTPYGCPIIVIKLGAQGQLLYNGESNSKYLIPAYPARVSDPTGAGDSFCGGFLAGYKSTSDPLQAVFYGSVSASLTIEGSGAFYPLETLPGLHQARLEILPESVRKA
jgi:sugar/nucleoside kinase (ribokinase family)